MWSMSCEAQIGSPSFLLNIFRIDRNPPKIPGGNMRPMQFSKKSKPSRVVSGLIIVSMLLTISAQLLLLSSPGRESLVSPWIIVVLSSVVLVWALFQFFRTNTTENRS